MQMKSAHWLEDTGRPSNPGPRARLCSSVRAADRFFMEVFEEVEAGRTLGQR